MIYKEHLLSTQNYIIPLFVQTPASKAFICGIRIKSPNNY